MDESFSNAIVAGANGVGIGTASPGSMLAISGGATVGSSYAATAMSDGNVAISGNVGIGTTSPSFPLHMGSGAHVTTGGVWTNASSREYKENIRDLTVWQAMAALGQLNPVTYNYKIDQNETYAGFIAEDVPDIVATEDRKSLSPMDIVAVLTKVVQEQQKMVVQLQQELGFLKKQIK